MARSIMLTAIWLILIYIYALLMGRLYAYAVLNAKLPISFSGFITFIMLVGLGPLFIILEINVSSNSFIYDLLGYYFIGFFGMISYAYSYGRKAKRGNHIEYDVEKKHLNEEHQEKIKNNDKENDVSKYKIDPEEKLDVYDSYSEERADLLTPKHF